MGRKTFDSIGRVLPGRKNIVVTRDPHLQELRHEPSVDVDLPIFVSSIEEGVKVATEDLERRQKLHKTEFAKKEIFIIGGAQIYEAALPLAGKLYLTLIDDEKEADIFFPPYEEQFTKVEHDEKRHHGGINYRWVDLVRE